MRSRSTLLIAAVVLLAAACAQSPDGGQTRQPVYVDSAELLIAESFPVQVHLHLSGNLPTPCHVFHAEVAEPDAQNRIEVTAYSSVAADAVCAQVLQPFEENIAIPMSDAADGTYSLWLNGEQVGEFSYPG